MSGPTIFVIPMPGASLRFREVGPARPKLMLSGFRKTVFDFAINSFARYFRGNPFIFITGKDPEVENTGSTNPHFVPKHGQSEPSGGGNAAFM